MTHTCADCGHTASDHYWERCLTCDESGYGCECDEDSIELVNGCDHIDGLTQTCECEGYREPKPVAADPDPEQPPLFELSAILD